jgi:hypothetical protein
MDLVGKMLPALRAADVVGFAVQDSSLVFIEEYVGVSAPLVTQAMRVLEALKPSAADLAVLHSVEIACWAPLTRYQHAESLVARGFGDEVVESAMKLGLGAGINHTVASAELNERVIDNPNVWGSASTGVDVATFLPLGLSRPTPGALTAATTARSRRRRPRRPGPRVPDGGLPCMPWGLAAYVAAWVAVVWAPASAWSTGAVGFTALAWTSIILFAAVHTLPIAIIWRWYY